MMSTWQDEFDNSHPPRTGFPVRGGAKNGGMEMSVQTIRLLSEAHAVLTSEQIADMAISMDLTPDEVRGMLNDVEDEWDALKYDAVSPEPRWGTGFGGDICAYRGLLLRTGDGYHTIYDPDNWDVLSQSDFDSTRKGFRVNQRECLAFADSYLSQLDSVSEVAENPNGERTEHSDGTVHYRLDGKLHREDGPAVIKPDGTQEWYKNGVRHREDGPAVIWPDGTQSWYINGQRHRDDGPAMTYPDRSESWWLHGKLHRADGPAVRNANGAEFWYKNGVRHREDGPATVYATGGEAWFFNGSRHRIDGPAYSRLDGTQEWHINGKLHRTDGPAVIFPDGAKEWWVNGIRQFDPK